MSEKLTEITNVSSVDDTALFYVVDPTRSAGDRDVSITKAAVQNDLVVPLLPSGLPTIENYYSDITDLLANQGSQTEGLLQKVKDATDDPDFIPVNSNNRAYYLKTDANTGSLDDYIRQTDDVADALDAGQGSETADCGTVIPLDTIYGHNCNMQSANANTAYTVSNGNLINAYARVLINASSEPTVSGATQQGGIAFQSDTDLILLVQNLGDAGLTYSFNSVAINTGEADTLQSVTERGANTTENIYIYSDAPNIIVAETTSGENSFAELSADADSGILALSTSNGNITEIKPREIASDRIQYIPDTNGDFIIINGTWNASTNSPTLANTDTNKNGLEYKVSVSGTVDFGAGDITFNVGDIVANDGSIWYKKVDNNQVLANTSSGNVVLDNVSGNYYGDYDSPTSSTITINTIDSVLGGEAYVYTNNSTLDITTSFNTVIIGEDEYLANGLNLVAIKRTGANTVTIIVKPIPSIVDEISPQLMWHKFDIATTSVSGSDVTNSTDSLNTTPINLVAIGTPTRNTLSGKECVSLDGSSGFETSGTNISSYFQSSFSVHFKVRLEDGNPASTRYFFNYLNGTVSRFIFDLRTDGKITVTYTSNSTSTFAQSASSVFSDGADTDFANIDILVDESSAISIYIDNSEVTLNGTFDGDMTGIDMSLFTVPVNPFEIACQSNNNFISGDIADFIIQPVLYTSQNRIDLAAL